MKFSSEYALVVLTFVYNMITVPTFAAVISKANTPLQDHSDTRCPSQLCSSTMTELNRTRFCSCDSDCYIFQDCCYDLTIKRNGIQSDRLPKAHLNVDLKCTHVPSLGWYFLVSSCPSGSMYSANVTSMNRHLCGGRSEVQPHMLDIPVTSATTGLTYKNVHCAVCNEDADDLLPRKAILKSTIQRSVGVPLEGAIYGDGTLSWEQDSGQSSRDLFPTSPEEEGSGGRGDFDIYGQDWVAAVLREFLSSSDGNFSGEEDLVKIHNIVDKKMKDLLGHERSILRDDGNFSEISPLEWILRFKANSGNQDYLRTIKDLLNKGVWSNQGWLTSTSETYMESDGELMKWMDNQENMTFSLGNVTKYWLSLDKEFLRPCKQFLDSCNPTWEGWKNVSELCHSYSMPVYTNDKGKGRQDFKNPHCAMCNYIPVSKLNCLNAKHLRPINKIFGEVLLPQIDFTFGNVLAGHENCGMRTVWDPLFNQCYFLDGVQEMDKSNSTPGPISISAPQSTMNLKKADIFEEEYILGEDDNCNEITLMTMSNVQWYLSSAFFGVSIICLGLHVVTYAYPSKLVESSPRETTKIHHSSRVSLKCKQINGHSFIILSWLLLIGQLLFAIGIRRSEIRAVCLSIAILHNFLSLASISWLSIFCLQVFKSHFSIQSFNSMSSYQSGMEAPPLKLTLLAWIIPTVFSILCLTLELVPGSLRPCLARGGACWYGETVSFRLFFVLPALLMLAGDGCIFTAIMFGTHEEKDQNMSTSIRGKSSSHIRRHSSIITNHDHCCFRLCARLGSVMTISWSCAVAASLGNLPSLWYGFVIFSGIQGIYIFVASGAKTRLTNLIWEKFTGHSKPMRRERSIKNNSIMVINT